MDRQKAISILKAKVQCEENQIAGAACKNHKECYECDLCYAQGKWGEQVECLKMAIEALQTEPIEVEAAKLQKAYDDGVRSGRNEFFNFDSPLVKTGEAISRQEVLDIGYANAWRTPEELRIYDLVEKLQSVKPQTEQCEDCISRQAAIDFLKKPLSNACMMEYLENAPSVNPQKVGKWIDTGSGQKCSVCGEIQYGYDNFRHFCANCGARMEDE